MPARPDLVNANLGLRFLLEPGALAAASPSSWSGRSSCPKAKIEVSAPIRFAIELTIWTAAGAALFSAGHSLLAIDFVTLALVSGALNAAWR